MGFKITPLPVITKGNKGEPHVEECGELAWIRVACLSEASLPCAVVEHNYKATVSAIGALPP